MTDDMILGRPKKDTRRAFTMMASLVMLGVELPSSKKSEKIDLPTKGMKGLSNAELKTSGKNVNARGKGNSGGDR